MSAWAAFRSAWRALAANALRSVLTMLGIVIGVAAVIAMVAVGRGATDRVQEQMQALGSNIMLVLPGGVSQAGVRLGAHIRQGLFVRVRDRLRVRLRELIRGGVRRHRFLRRRRGRPGRRKTTRTIRTTLPMTKIETKAVTKQAATTIAGRVDEED